MQGSEIMLFQYMEGSSKRFIIPVYQRNYDWKIEQCKKLYDDLIKVHRENRRTHFFGSLVSSQDSHSGMQEYLIIDGQQRLTTVSLLLLALHNLMVEERVSFDNQFLPARIKNEYLVDKYSENHTRVKLKPVKNDAEAFEALIEDRETMIESSNISINYNYFYERIQHQELSAEELFNAFCRLQIINIYLNNEDNPQLIFESLNSTGLDLSEGDKIRNYILMNIKPTHLQEKFYEDYWHKIEKCTDYEVSAFVRDYLSIKMQTTPNIKKVYITFKDYMAINQLETGSPEDILKKRQALLKDLLNYARRFEMLQRASTTHPKLNVVIQRLLRFEATVTRPFLMEVLRYSEREIEESERISKEELVEIFKIVESFLFRRQICEIPTNALNKLFVALNREILRYDGTTKDYLDKLKYTLRKKTKSGIFPDDYMFTVGLSNREVYRMSPRSKKYIMERLENWGTREVKDVWNLIEEGTYTIEHIMPQTLSSEWKKKLGPDYKLIHEQWLNKLANLTLTAYNTNYTNRSFEVKKTMKNGFIDSGLRMNQQIAQYEQWTPREMKDRNEYLVRRALEIWPMVETDYEPPVKPMDSVTLADEISLTGRKIEKISLLGTDYNVKSWIDAYMKVLAVLHAEQPEVLQRLAVDQSGSALSNVVASNPDELIYSAKLEDHIYLWTKTSTDTKLNYLRKFFQLYDVSEEELIFYLKDERSE